MSFSNQTELEVLNGRKVSNSLKTPKKVMSVVFLVVDKINCSIWTKEVLQVEQIQKLAVSYIVNILKTLLFAGHLLIGRLVVDCSRLHAKVFLDMILNPVVLQYVHWKMCEWENEACYIRVFEFSNQSRKTLHKNQSIHHCYYFGFWSICEIMLVHMICHSNGKLQIHS